MDCSLLRKRYQQVESERSNIEGTFTAIERYVMPFSGKFDDTHDSEYELDWRKRHLLDSTAVIANQNLAANIHAGITSPVFQWFDFRFFEEKLNKQQAAIEWLAECSRRVFFTLQQSNFNLEVNNVYLDLTGFGTGFLLEEIEEDSKGDLKRIIFHGIPMAEAYFEDDHNGRIVYFYRHLKWTALQIYTKFGEETPADIKEEALEGKKTDNRHSVIFAIYPREGVKIDPKAKAVARDKRPFGSKYFMLSDGDQLGEEDGYYEMPVFIPRWRRTTGSKWGHSPGMICLSDVLTLNALVELTLKAAEKVVDPPILTTRRGVFGDIDLEASGVTVVSSLEGLKAFESGARFDVSSLQKADLQQSIRQTFFMDQLQLKESPAMTATEVQVRYELMQRLMGPTLNQLQYDFLDPLVQRTFRILYRYNKLPEIDESIRKLDPDLNVEYLGPMSRAQKADQVAAIERWLGTLGQMAEAYPAFLEIPKVDDIGRYLGLAGGVPPELINGEDDVNADRKKKEKAAEGQQKLDAAERVSGIVKNLGGAEALNGEGLQEAAASEAA